MLKVQLSSRIISASSICKNQRLLKTLHTSSQKPSTFAFHEQKNKRNAVIATVGTVVAAVGTIAAVSFAGYTLFRTDTTEFKQSTTVVPKNKPFTKERTYDPTVSQWKRTLDKVTPAIVSLKLNYPRAFDTDVPRNSSATGFVVDAENGIILTNRHVVGPGPVDAEAIFHDNEEVKLTPIYRDPIHDFGFFKYNPKDVKHLDVPSLPLNPNNAFVGTDIRVIGNDASEKFCIASGTLARLDRPAPNYGAEKYNDFNTFYYQASSGTSGGSSGSPVLNNKGEVIALNAGGRRGTSASFFLPLYRVKRALNLIQEGQPVSRGSIQTVFLHKPFDELRRLGIKSETEDYIREADKNETGLLVAQEIVPGGPADRIIEPGDILLRINKKLITNFISLDEMLDNNVDKNITVEVERAGKTIIKTIKTQDLHKITPSMYLEFGGAIFNPLSYQQAKNHGLECGLPYVADPGYFLQRSKINRGSVITRIDDTETPTLGDLKTYLEKCYDGQRVILHKKDIVHGKIESLAIAKVNRKWFPCQECSRNDISGAWDCVKLKDTPKPTFNLRNISGQTSVLEGKNPVESKLSKSLVMVDFDRPFCVNSLTLSAFGGTGLILDAAKGLIVVDRNTVPDSIGDAQITFANTLTVPARVVYIHPVHNFALLRYDPASIGTTPVSSCNVDHDAIKPSDKAWLVGLTNGHGQNTYSELVSRETLISGTKWIRLSLPFPPRYQEHNIELVGLQDSIQTEGGALCNEVGEVQAFWGSFSYQQRDRSGRKESSFMRGIPIHIIMETVKNLKEGNTKLYDLGVDFEHVSLAVGRQLGISQELAQELEQHSPEHRIVLSVLRRWGGSDAAKYLRNGDILVKINGKYVSSFREAEMLSQQPVVNLTIIRNGKELSYDVKTVELGKIGVEHVVFWQGLLLQPPPLALASQREISTTNGLYVSGLYAGSPAARYGPSPTTRIFEIDDVKITSVQDFIQFIKTNKNKDSVRVKYMDLRGKKKMTTIKLEPEFWPACELVYENEEWIRKEL